MKKVILQQYFKTQINNGGPATCAVLLMNSFLKRKYEFKAMDESHNFWENPLKQLFYFYKTIKQEKPDLVHIRGVQLEGFYGVLAAKLAGVKCVMSVDGLMIDAQNIGKVKRFVFKRILEPFALKHADLTYCVCQYAADRAFVQQHTKHLYGCIHNAAPIYDLSNRENERINKRKALGIADNEIVLTNIGRITREKGIHVLVESFAQITKKHNNVRLCIAGMGDYIHEIETNYSRLIAEGKILLLGKISDVKETLLASDVFVFPTLHENLSNSLLEAATVGLPIIATNVGGNPEVIEHNKSGLLINPDNVGELTDALLQVIEDSSLRTDLGKQAVVKIESEYTQEKIFERMAEMYDKVLSE